MTSRNYHPSSRMLYGYAKWLVAISSGSTRSALSREIRRTGVSNPRIWRIFIQTPTSISRLPRFGIVLRASFRADGSQTSTSGVGHENISLRCRSFWTARSLLGSPTMRTMQTSKGHTLGYFSVPLPQSPLLTRAWVFQEILLVCRTLHICASELIWECNTSYACKYGSHPYDKHVQRPGISSEMHHRSLYVPRKQEFVRIRQENYASRQEISDLWLRVSHEYSSLYLTYAPVRFFATVGIAQAVQKLMNGIYLTGIWAEDLPRSLLWAPSTECDVHRADDAPTWSWMSLCSYENWDTQHV